MQMLRVRQYMTPSPQYVSGDLPLMEAQLQMRLHRIRHLPVVEEGEVVGILSQRDVFLMETLRDADPEAATVRETMRPAPYTVTPDAPLDEVARAMWADRLGCVLVLEKQRLVGIFTRSDALRALAALLQWHRD